MRSIRFLEKLRFVFVIGACCILVAGCDSGESESSGLDDGKNPDDNTPADDCSIDADEWGTGLTVGQVVANWSMPGYAAPTGDFEVDQTDTTFTLEDVNCAGHNALVVLLGDTG